MATTRPEAAPFAALIAASLTLGLSGGVHTCAIAETRIQPAVDAELVHTSNGNLNSTGPARSDTVLSATAGLNVSLISANSSLTGQWGYRALHSAQGLQKDSVVPNGQLNLHTDVMHQGIGLDASVSATQVQSSFAASNDSTPSSQGRYTNTEWRVGPFIERSLDEYTSLRMRLTRGLQQSSQTDQTLVSRPSAHLRNDSLSISRRPTPLGYTLSRTWESTTVAGQDDPVLRKDATKGSLRYALSPELDLGLVAGLERTRAFPSSFLDHPRGWLLDWRPSQRTQVSTDVEQRFFGRSWVISVSHRTPWMAMGLNAERVPSTSLFTTGSVGAGGSTRDLFDAMLTTRIPDAQERSKAVDELLSSRNIPTQLSGARDFYSLTAQLRQAVSGRVAFMGRRDTWLNQAGLIKSRPLGDRGTQIISTPVDDRLARQYFVDSQLTHQLTPQSSLTGGLRWSRARELIAGNEPIVSREFSWRLAMNTTLASSTTATVGMRRVLRHSTNNTTGNANAEEAALFMGLGHRF
jgi:uncharacterized protein (PEP-CTERM system associated)